MVVGFIGRRSVAQLAALAFAMRFLLVLYSALHDAVFTVKYTDIDYHVVTDGAAHWYDGGFWGTDGGTPFDRATFRYTPLLALLCMPNVWWFPAGKVALCLCDVVAGAFCVQVLRRAPFRAEERTAKLLVSAFTWFNPVVINVSTRGNSDMLITFLVLGMLHSFATGRYAAAGLWLGLGIHMKIYPVVYVPALLAALWHSVGRTRGVAAFLRSSLAAALATAVAAAAPTVLCWARFGQRYLDEALLYHIGRVDHRHNLSPYFYQMYLGLAVRWGDAVPVELQGDWTSTGLAFLPQVVCLLATALVLRRNVAHAVTVATMLFVAFNKVCTVQYFVWFLPLLPFAIVHQVGKGGGPGKATLAAVVYWAGALIGWMLCAKRLEFDGESVHRQLWLWSLAFFLAQIAVTVVVIRAVVRAQRAQSAKAA